MCRESYAEIAARIVLTVAICAMSWAFGGVESIAKLWLARSVGLAAVLVLLAKPSLSLGARALPAVWLVLLAAVGIGFLHLAPLDTNLVEGISPHSIALRSELGAVVEESSRLTIAEPETRRDLSLLLLGVAAFCIASQVFQTVASQLFLCFSVAINGAALSIWGLIQQLNHRNDLLPGIPCEVNSIIFSTYVNHSSAAGFLNMCLGATTGLLLWRYRWSPNNTESLPASRIVGDFFRSLTPVLLLLIGITTLLLAALGSSLSRGGCLATVISFAIVTLLVMRRKSKSVGFSTTVIGGTIGAAALIWLGFAGPLASRYVSVVGEDGVVNDSRIGHWSDGLRAAENFLTVGSGLGTYSSAYLTVEENDNPHWFRHAHNQYLEALVDAGIPGLLLLLTAIGMVAFAAWHLSTQREVGVHSWFGIGVIFVMSSQAIHAVTDFGLYLPANMLLCAVMGGAVSGTAATTGKSWLLRMPMFMSRPVVWNIAIFAGCVFALNHFRGAEASAKSLVQTRLEMRTVNRAGVEETEAALKLLRQTSANDSTNADVHFRIARQLLLRYQAKAFEVLRNNDGLAKSDAELWKRASAEQLHATLVNLSAEDRKRQVAALMTEPAVMESLVAARQHLLSARQCNPFRPRIHVYLAILAPLFNESDLPHLDRADSLSQTDAEANFGCGLLHLRANRTTRAIESWKRSLSFSRDYVDLVLSIGRTRLDDEILANEVMPEDPVLLLRVAESKHRISSESRLARLLATRVLTMENKRTPQESDYYRGRAATLLGKETLAAKHFGNAVRLSPNQSEWRYRYAIALNKSGQLAEAEEQLQWCLGVYPGNAKYQRLMQTVKRRSEASEL
jgi:O-antigen ligase/tetratricopeptide (TPR) repeat protein